MRPSRRSIGKANTRFWGQALGLGLYNEESLYMAEQYLAKAKRRTNTAGVSGCERNGRPLSSSRRVSPKQAARSRATLTIADGYVALAGALSFTGKTGEAVDALERAMRLNPHYPASYAYQLGLAQFSANRLTDAAASLERALAISPGDYWSQRLLLATYGLLGRRDDAARLVEAMKRKDQRGSRAYTLDPLTIRALAYWYPFARPDDASAVRRGFAQGGRSRVVAGGRLRI